MYLVANVLSAIKNAVSTKQNEVLVASSKYVESVLLVLKKEAFINDYEVLDNGILVKIRYVDGEPMIKDYKMVSKPSQRIYVKYGKIIPVQNGRGISIISTSRGVMSGSLAKAMKLGGEYICKVW